MLTDHTQISAVMQESPSRRLFHIALKIVAGKRTFDTPIINSCIAPEVTPTRKLHAVPDIASTQRLLVKRRSWRLDSQQKPRLQVLGVRPALAL